MTKRSELQTAALVFGVIFLVVGLLGFIPGIYTETLAAGGDSSALLLGIFQVSVIHNLVHIIFGVVGILASRTAGNSRQYLLVGGIIYLVLFLLGLVGALGWLPANSNDNLLHLVLGLGMVGAALALGKRRI